MTIIFIIKFPSFSLFLIISGVIFGIFLFLETRPYSNITPLMHHIELYEKGLILSYRIFPEYLKGYYEANFKNKDRFFISYGNIDAIYPGINYSKLIITFDIIKNNKKYSSIIYDNEKCNITTILIHLKNKVGEKWNIKYIPKLVSRDINTCEIKYLNDKKSKQIWNNLVKERLKSNPKLKDFMIA